MMNILKQHQNKEWLEKKYIEEKLSMFELANVLQLNRETIRYWLLKNNIPIRSGGEANLLWWKKKRINITKEELIKKYVNEKMTMRECSKYFNCTATTIKNRLKEYNIPGRKTCEANKGRKVWNKGKKGLQTSWLKGTKGLIKANKGSFKKGQNSGSKHPRWKGGITPIYKLIRSSAEYKEWRLMVLGRDNFTCQDCGKRGTYLHVHHKKSLSLLIQYYEITSIDEALKCKELFSVDNGITFCEECHGKYHKELGFFKNTEAVSEIF